MVIQYKFRSVVNFETVEIEGRASISVGELRAKILLVKCPRQRPQGFDLELYDAVSGLEYKSDDYQIPNGSSVIVKRVPDETQPATVSPIQAVKDVRRKDSHNLNIATAKDRFDDFGADLRLVPDWSPDQNLEFNKNNIEGNEKDGIPFMRLERQNLDSSGPSQAIPRGSSQFRIGGNTLRRVDERMKLNNLPTSNDPALQHPNLPVELRCWLCLEFFKDAVMIPCCQHSFCDECIRQVLIDERKCPKCFSRTYREEHLIPNLALRGAVKHFLKPQMLEQKYVPDVESEIDSPLSADVESETDSNPQRKGGFDSAGGEGNSLGLGGHRKVVCNCCTCGSPDHLTRDCPVSNSSLVFQPGNGVFHGGMPGYAPTYWNGPSLPPVKPFANMYSNPAVMPFNASMVPASPLAVPSYMPSMYGGMPGPGGIMRIENMGPPLASNYIGLQPCESEMKHSNENLGREQLSDEGDSPEKLDDKEKEQSLSGTGDSLAQRLRRKSQHDRYMMHSVDGRHERINSFFAGEDKRLSHAERSNLVKKNMHKNCDRYIDWRHKQNEESKRCHEKRRCCDSDSSLGHHSAQKDVKRRVGYAVKGSHKRYLSFPDSDRRRDYKERDPGHDGRPCRHSAKGSWDRQHDDRQKMVNRSDEERRDGYRYHKRRAH